jgi:hypothetical protein
MIMYDVDKRQYVLPSRRETLFSPPYEHQPVARGHKPKQGICIRFN